MKKVLWFTVGGLHQKILILVQVFLIVLMGVFLGVSSIHTRRLSSIVDETRSEQQAAIDNISGETMHFVIENTMTKMIVLQAQNADDAFEDVTNNVRMLRDIAEGMFANRSGMAPAEVFPPDPAKDGVVSSYFLCEQGVDYTRSEYLGIAANMCDTMMAMCSCNDRIGNCYIGLADGTHIAVGTSTKEKYDESGALKPFPVRERPWYRGAAEKGDLYFTGLEKDAFGDSTWITCSAPVIVDGRLYGVVGIDIVVDDLCSYASDDENDSGFVCIVNEEGKVIVAPGNNGLFTVSESESAEDLRKSDNKQLAAFVENALSGETGLEVVTVDGREYYMAGSPMKSIGWAVVSVVDKQITEEPAKKLRSEYDRINADATATYRSGSDNSAHTVYVMLGLVFVIASVAALIVADRIVDPVESMTKEIIAGATTGKLFEMRPEYKTGDEIQVLAESFDDLSRKTKQYIIDLTRITKEKERIGTELELAKRIQADMLPDTYPAFPERSEFDIYASMTPAKEVGGDFYDYFLIDDDHLCLVIADVSGKGVPAALFMMMTMILIKTIAESERSPGAILEKLNRMLCANNREEMFVTVWLGVLDILSGELTAANAGHEYPVIRKAGGEYELIKDKHGFVIGGMDQVRYKEYTLQLEKGSTLFVYTDGVPEATDGEGQMFGTDRMLESLNEADTDDPKQLLEKERAAVDRFVGDAEQFDDLTMLAVTLK